MSPAVETNMALFLHDHLVEPCGQTKGTMPPCPWSDIAVQFERKAPRAKRVIHRGRTKRGIDLAWLLPRLSAQDDGFGVQMADGACLRR